MEVELCPICHAAVVVEEGELPEDVCDCSLGELVEDEEIFAEFS